MPQKTYKPYQKPHQKEIKEISPEVRKVPEQVVEDSKTKSEFKDLENEIKKNEELFIKHKINPNKLQNPKNAKKKNTKKKMVAKKEDFPGLPS